MTEITSVQGEHVTGRFNSREIAEQVVERLREIGVSEQGISVRDGERGAQSRVHIGEGIGLGVVIGTVLGGLFGAIVAAPQTTLLFLGQRYVAEGAGAMMGAGGGMALGIILGVIVGFVARHTATSPIHDFEELLSSGAFVEALVPRTLAGRAREIVNAA